jgi:hypothetical protein
MGRWLNNPVVANVMPGWSIDLSSLLAFSAVGIVTDEGSGGSGFGMGEVVLHVVRLQDDELLPIGRLVLGEWSWSRGSHSDQPGVPASQSWNVMKPRLEQDSLVLTPGPRPPSVSSYRGRWTVTPPRAAERYRWVDDKLVRVEGSVP